MNVVGTNKLFEMSKLFINLENFVHVSTAYVSNPKNEIEECIIEVDNDEDV